MFEKNSLLENRKESGQLFHRKTHLTEFQEFAIHALFKLSEEVNTFSFLFWHRPLMHYIFCRLWYFESFKICETINPILVSIKICHQINCLSWVKVINTAKDFESHCSIVLALVGKVQCYFCGIIAIALRGSSIIKTMASFMLIWK